MFWPTAQSVLVDQNDDHADYGLARMNEMKNIIMNIAEVLFSGAHGHVSCYAL